MNLASIYSEGYEYRAPAMQRFDAMLLRLQSTKRRLRPERRVPPKTQPSLKLDWQREMWKVLGEARCALMTTDIYMEIREEFSDTRRKRQRIRMILLSWYRAGWILRSGMERNYLYRRAK